jgi:hypothetical protein
VASPPEGVLCISTRRDPGPRGPDVDLPFVELFKPGQPAPYGEFPYVALAVGAAAIAIALVTVRRHPSTGAGEGETSADT